MLSHHRHSKEKDIRYDHYKRSQSRRIRLSQTSTTRHRNDPHPNDLTDSPVSMYTRVSRNRLSPRPSDPNPGTPIMKLVSVPTYQRGDRTFVQMDPDRESGSTSVYR